MKSKNYESSSGNGDGWGCKPIVDEKNLRVGEGEGESREQSKHQCIIARKGKRCVIEGIRHGLWSGRKAVGEGDAG